MQAIILSIGDELALGQIVDTNAAWLSARLVAYGITTRYHQTLPDDREVIGQAVRRAAEEADWVILTGGLGPTPDDLTRQALADILGTPLVLNPSALERIEQFFKARGRVMTDSNRVQALCPVGAESLENPCGTAPGLKLRQGRAIIFSLPGVPSEMKAMFELHLAPLMVAQAGQIILVKKINTFGLGESQVSERLGELMRRDRNPKVGTTVSSGIVSIRIRSEFKTVAEAQEVLNRTVREVHRCLGTAVFSEEDTTLPEVVARLLSERRRTVVTAESCTAGLVGKMLTEPAGASAYYLGGWIVYANQFKHEWLGVPSDMMARDGAVSEAVVRHMAEQALKRSGADYALALTGIAGPDGGSPDKPVGTVWMALGIRQPHEPVIQAERFLFSGAREMVRERAANTVLNLLRLELIRENR